jgi:hypothetical protein
MKPSTLRAMALMLFAAAVSSASATPAQSEALRALNRDVWEPFVRGVSTFDDAAYLGVRSRDFVMVQQGKPHFLDHDFYTEDSVKVMRELKDAGTRLALEVRFEERMTDGEYSSERGLVRTTVTDAANVSRTSHSRFHSIARLEGGHWRVLTEYRSAAGKDAATAFASAHPMGDVDAAMKE